MLKRVLICDIHTYVGLNTIQLDPKSHISAILGPNGAGKSTFLDSLTFVAGFKNLQGVSENAFAEVILESGVSMRRYGSGECTINNEPCGSQEFKEMCAESFKIFTITNDSGWRTVLETPKLLLKYIEDLWFHENTPEVDPVVYQEAVEEANRCAKQAQKSTTKLHKLRNNLRSMESARKIHEEVKLARKMGKEYRVRIDICTLALLEVQMNSISAEQSKLTQELQYLNGMKEQDQLVLDRTSKDLKEIMLEISRLTMVRTNVKTELSILFDKKNQLQFEVEIVQYCSQGCAMLNKIVLDHTISNLERRIEIIESQLEAAKGLGNAPEIVAQWQSQGLRFQVQSLQQLKLELKAVINDLDYRLSGLIPELEKVQSKCHAVRKSQDSIDIELLLKELKLSQCNRELQRCESMAKDFDDSDGGMVTGLDEIVNSLQLLYPEVLGGVNQFVYPNGGPFISKKRVFDILCNIIYQRNEVAVVVEDDEVAINLARRVSIFRSRAILFLPRKLSTETPSIQKNIPEPIFKKYPSISWLTSLLHTRGGNESHLIEYIAQDYLLVPGKEAVEFISQFKSLNCQICDFEGNCYTAQSISSHNLRIVSENKETTSSKVGLYHSELVEEIQELELETRKIRSALENHKVENSKTERVLHGLHFSFTRLEQLRSSVRSLYENITIEIEQLEDRLAPQLSLRNCLYQGLKIRDLVSSEVLEQESVYLKDKLKILSNELLVAVANQNKLTDVNSSEESCNDSDVLNRINILDAEIGEARDSLVEYEICISQFKQDAKNLEAYLESEYARPTKVSETCNRLERELDELQLSLDYYKTKMKQTTTHLKTVAYDNDLDFNDNGIRNEVESVLQSEGAVGSYELIASIKAEIKDLQTALSRNDQIVKDAINNSELEAQYVRDVNTLDTLHKDAKKCMKAHVQASQVLERLREKKHSRASERVERIAPHLENVYRSLYSQIGNASAQVYLKLVDDKDIDRGISFYAVPAGKPFCTVSDLSGGEFTLALFAFQIAVGLALGRTIFLIDEMDANLDGFTGRSFVNLLMRITRTSCKVLLVTHQRRLYNQADQYIGVFKSESKTSFFVAKRPRCQVGSLNFS